VGLIVPVGVWITESSLDARQGGALEGFAGAIGDGVMLHGGSHDLLLSLLGVGEGGMAVGLELLR
jgi:hypothetical protein